MPNSDSNEDFQFSFRTWFSLFSHLFFSSVLLLFLFWTLTSFWSLDSMRTQAASSAHLLLIFDTPPSPSEIQGLVKTMEKVSGSGTVTSFHPQDAKSPTEQRNSKRILSVAVSLGQGPHGQVVTLGDQIRSIQQIVKNDTSIKEIVYNPQWVARVDLLAGISEGMKKALEILVGALCLGLGLYWASWGNSLWSHLFSPHSTGGRSSSERRSPLFQRESIPDEQVEFPSLPPPIPGPSGIVRIFASGFCGFISGGVAVFVAWILRTFLYPGMDNPFRPGFIGTTTYLDPLWIAFILACGLVGWLGGILYLLLPFPTRKEGSPLP